MVKVTGPMMSMAASGTLADTLVFGTWKGRPYVRERVIPSNPKTGPQVGRRAMFKFLSQEWDALLAATKATWQTPADQLVASPFNAYLAENMNRWHNFKAPTQASPAAEGDTPSDESLQIADWQENRIVLGSMLGTANQAWGAIIFASLSTPLTSSVANAILLLDHDVVTTYTMYWTPPTVAKYYFTMRTFSKEGVLGAQTATVNSGDP